MPLIRACLALFFALGSPALAAKIELLPSGPCFAKLSGQITKGDVDAFARLEKANPREGDGETLARNQLCLDSPGGSLTEGIALANYLANNRIGTRVEARASCLSACSLAFMAGTLGGNEEITGFDRVLDVHGKLGFHRPAISLNTDKTFDAKAIEKSFDLALEATLNFVALSNRRQVLMPEVMVKSDLIEEMFTHRGQDFFYIDTVDKAARFDVQLHGYEMPQQIGMAEAWNVCENMGHWPVERNDDNYQPFTGFDPYEKVRIARRDEYGLVYAVRGSGDGLVEHACYVQLAFYPEEGVNYLQGCGNNEITGAQFGGSGCSEGSSDGFFGIPDLAIFPPDMPIQAINSASRAIDARPPTTLETVRADGISNFRKGCNVYGRPSFVANVQNFVNLRSAQGFGQSVVAELPLDQQLQGFEGPLFSGDPTLAGLCDQACGRAESPDMSPADLRNLSQCYEENMIWYGVETATGLSGYVSGKYLRY